jgi:predicted Zn-dependent peptidase
LKTQNTVEIIDTQGRILVYDNIPDRKSFAFGITVPAGSAAEMNGIPHGTAHFTEHMLFKGFQGTGQLKLTRLMERLGVEANAFTTKNSTHYYIRGRVENFRKALLPFLKSVFEPSLLTKDIVREKQIIAEEISSYEDDWEENIFELSDELMLASTPYAHSITGTKMSIQNIDRDTLIEFHENHYIKGHIVFSYSGSQSMQSYIVRSIEKILGRQLQSENIAPSTYTLIGSEDIKLPLRESKNITSPNSHLLWSFYMGEPDMRKRICLSLYNYIMGEGNSSRLFWELREKKALSYHNYSTVTSYGKDLFFSVYISANPKSEKVLVNSLKKQLFNPLRLKSGEFQIAKEQIITQLVIESEDLMFRMQANAKDIITYGRLIGEQEVISIIQDLQKSEIEEIGLQVSPDNLFAFTLKGES